MAFHQALLAQQSCVAAAVAAVVTAILVIRVLEAQAAAVMPVKVSQVTVLLEQQILVAVAVAQHLAMRILQIRAAMAALALSLFVIPILTLRLPQLVALQP